MTPPDALLAQVRAEAEAAAAERAPARARFRALACALADLLRDAPDPLGVVAPAADDGRLRRAVGAVVRPGGTRDDAFDRAVAGSLLSVLAGRAAGPVASGLAPSGPGDDADAVTTLVFDALHSPPPATTAGGPDLRGDPRP